MSGIIIQLLTFTCRNTRIYKPYICAINKWNDAPNIRVHGDLLLQAVIRTDQKMPDAIEIPCRDTSGKMKILRLPVLSPIKGWYLVNYQGLNTCSGEFDHDITTRLPTPNSVWTNVAYTFREWRQELVKLPLTTVVNLECKQRNVLHISKMSNASGVDTLTDISWAGTKGPINLSAYGIIIFELSNEESKFAAEIMCKGKSTYHLGNCLQPSQLRELYYEMNSKEKLVGRRIRAAL